MASRYEQLPLSTKALLEDEERLSEIVSAAEFYSRLRPEFREFCYRADESTLELLSRARSDEVKQWAAASEFMKSAGVVGRFLFKAMTILAAAITAGAVIAVWWQKK